MWGDGVSRKVSAPPLHMESNVATHFGARFHLKAICVLHVQGLEFSVLSFGQFHVFLALSVKNRNSVTLFAIPHDLPNFMQNLWHTSKKWQIIETEGTVKPMSEDNLECSPKWSLLMGGLY